MRDGKRVVSRLYSLKLRLKGELNISTIPLGVSDREAAEEKARKLVKEREQELAGLLAPKVQRDAAQATFAKHVQDFIGDLRVKGRNSRYVDEMEFKLTTLAEKCSWQRANDVTADSFVKWRSGQTKAKKTLNEYLTAVKGLLNWMIKQGRIGSNPLLSVQRVETRGNEKLNRRAFTNQEMLALLNASGPRGIVYMTAALTGLRHGECKKLQRGDLNLGSEKPSVMVRASISKNHQQACLPLHPQLRRGLVEALPANASPGDLVLADLVPRPSQFKKDLAAAGIAKRDGQDRVVDFHSFRHTFCTNLHLAGVPLREAMELMRHSDVRLTMKIYADSSLFALRPAIEKLLPWNCAEDDSQRDSQKLGAEGPLASLAGTVNDDSKNENQPVNMGLKSLSVTLGHGGAESGEWCALQVSNLRPLPCEGNALPLS